MHTNPHTKTKVTTGKKIISNQIFKFINYIKQCYYSKKIQKLPDVLMNGHLNRSGPITAIAMDSTTTTWLYRSPNSSSHLWSLGLFDCASSVNWTILLRVDSFQVFVTCNQLFCFIRLVSNKNSVRSLSVEQMQTITETLVPQSLVTCPYISVRM